jgi:hypothetical protein
VTLPTVYLIYVFLLFASAFVIFRIFVRPDYRQEGRLTLALLKRRLPCTISRIS